MEHSDFFRNAQTEKKSCKLFLARWCYFDGFLAEKVLWKEEDLGRARDTYISNSGLDIKNLSDFYNQKTNSRGEGWGETYRYIGRIRWRLKDDDIYTKDKIKKLFDNDEKQVPTIQSCIQN